MTAPREALWVRLRQAGFVSGDMPLPSSDATPWFVRVMLGIAGWIGALFLLGFVGAGFAFVLHNVAAALIMGLLVCGGAVALFRAGPRSDFATQFGLAISLFGQGLIGFGFSEAFGRNLAGVAGGMAFVEVALFLLAPNFLHRILCAWAAAFALTIVLGRWHAYAVAPAVLAAGFACVWLNEFASGARRSLMRAAGYGLALALMQSVLMLSVVLGANEHFAREIGGGGPAVAWSGALLSGGVLVAVAWRLLAREGVSLASRAGRAAMAVALLLALASAKAPGLAAATLIVVLGHANGNRVLLGLGVAALLGYLSHYYYALDVTLLQKSALLLGAGAALLVTRLAARLWWQDAPPAEAARA